MVTSCVQSRTVLHRVLKAMIFEKKIARPVFRGLCLSQRDVKRYGPLPKPKLSAWPSSVVPPKSNVTLRCWTATREVHFALKKGKTTLDFPYRVGSQSNPTESLAEFHLTELQTGDSGEYTCEYYRILSPYTASQPSDVLLLVVTGDLPKPSLRAYPARNVAERKEVTLQCQKPGDVISYVMFALLKEGTPAPIQYWRPFGDMAQFSLKNVAVKDTGNYSCVYYQTRGPFWASHPSDSLEIWVTVSPGNTLGDKPSVSPNTTSGDYTKGNIIRLGLAALILIIMAAFLVEAGYSQKESLCGSRSHNLPGKR
ncbi:T-cell-interacting, activating receptor on myeloid cells protein 1-like isoform X2 [Loxodonta africana]|uniref:T-cell-interacting, activating receptor on myeloid cells protein 1-like isoform X2 n=1 Tax=Loxodonta africana TaxID=9785 RepID=UPI0030D21C7C